MTDSCSNSSVGSPYASSTDLRDEDDLMLDRVRRKSRGRRTVGGMDLDDAEYTVRSIQQDTNDIKSEFTGLKSQSQSQKRRILDLENQFEDARVRIDKLLQRKTLPRTSSFDASSPPSSNRSSSVSSRTSVKVSSGNNSPPPETHKTQININPSNNNTKQVFGTVTLTVKVDEE